MQELYPTPPSDQEIPAAISYDLPEFEAPEPEHFDSARITKILFESFRHSQGSPGLQRQILGFIGERHAGQLRGFGEDEADEALVEEVYTSLTAQASRYITRGAAHQRIDQAYINQNPRLVNQNPEEFIDSQVVNAIIELKAGVDRGPDSSWLDAARALNKIVEMDAKYIEPRDEGEGSGRPRPGVRPDPDEHGLAVEISHHASHLVLYGLIGHPTRVPEIDEFYSEMTAKLPILLNGHYTKNNQFERQLTAVITQHIQYYPADADRVQPQYREFLVRHWGESKAREVGLTA